ncbi:MAG: ATPase, T2SS/T4P/T4SS family [Candidatus Diapherotrites archaeon]|nr:ATPase, T2SS/T4P/T4SS family [Candidatus Diapherotrites archaeon]
MERIKQTVGKKLVSYDRITIYEGFPYFYYEVNPFEFEKEEKNLTEILKGLIKGEISFDEAKIRASWLDDLFLKEFREKIISTITYKNALSLFIDNEDIKKIKLISIALIKKYLPKVKNVSEVTNETIDNTIGYGILAPLIEDQDLEEIMVNGYKKPVFVFHKKYGMCITNIEVEQNRKIDNIIQRIALTVGKEINQENPLLDARLNSGDRANATHFSVTPGGPTLTIRKFNKTPISIIDLIVNNTLNSELAAFLWVMVEGLGIEPKNIIVTGGTSSGKTTLLNALTSFIKYDERIITIEDTLELNLGDRENWIQMESRPRIKGYEEVTMDDLLKNALRMRPDRIIVGEVRGKEAQTLFIAMDTGHEGIMGTLHSNSGKELILRLKSEPMNVPESIIPLLDLVIVMKRTYHKDIGIIRRVAAVCEITSMDGKPLISEIYLLNKEKDVVERTDIPAHSIESLSEKTMKTKKEITREILVRKKILEWMVNNKIRQNRDVETIIQTYYSNPEELLRLVMKTDDLATTT